MKIVFILYRKILKLPEIDCLGLDTKCKLVVINSFYLKHYK
jgi:hypothetical protein